MEIRKEMINWLRFPKEVIELALAPYLECPPGEFPYVMQHHWRQASVHVDWRMAVNDHLVGYTILDNPKGTPKVMDMDDARKAEKTVPFVFKAKNKNIGKRAETKARQPCISRDSFVVGSSNLLKAGELSINDKILSASGRFQRIKGIQEIPPKKDMFLIQPRHGLPIKVDGDHLFLVNDCDYQTFAKVSRKERKRIKTLFNPKWLPARELRKNMIVLFPKAKFGSQGNYNLGRLFGFFLGDGSRSLEGKPRSLVWRLSFNLKTEKEKAKEYQRILKGLGIHSWERIGENESVLEIKFRLNRQKKNFLFEQFYKEGKKSVPLSFLEMNEEFDKGFLTGLIESDGYIDKNGRRYITNSNLSIINAAVIILSKFNILPVLRYRRNRKYNSKELGNMIAEISWSSSREIFDYGSYLGTRIRKIKEIEPEPLINIVTEDHTFCVPYMITHNTEWLKVSGVVKAGDPGATEHGPGVFFIFDKGKVIFGTQKPYYHEYFLKSSMGKYFPKDWTRVVVRRVGVFKLDPVCLSEDSLILTRTGLKEAKEIEKGDQVINLEGKFEKVLEVYPIEDKEQYVINPWFGPSFQVNGEHPILINEVPQKYNRQKMNNRMRIKRKTIFKPKFIPAREIKVGDIVLFPQLHFQKKYFGSFEEGRLLGMFLADGSIQNKYQIGISFNRLTEEKLAKEYQRLAERVLKVKTSLSTYKKKNEIRLFLRERKFFDSCLKNGVKNIPPRFLGANIEFIEGLMTGLREGDGNKKFFGFANRNKNLIGMAALLAFKIGKIPFCHRIYTKDGIDYHLHWTDSLTHRKFIDYRDFGFIGFRILRKQKAKKVKTLINIETKSGTFCLPFLVTHNTKKPLKKREIMWRVLIPGNQMPYTISPRARRKKYKPPKTNRTPFPVSWAKEKWPKQYTKWEEYMKGKVEEKTVVDLIKSFEGRPEAYCASIARRTGEIKSLSAVKFTLHFNSWMGAFVVRGVPKREWYLRIDDKGTGKIRSFFFDHDPLYYEPISGEDEGRVDRKWLEFEGKIAPRTVYNPNKKISAFMKIVDKGTVDFDSETENGIEIISLKFKGKKLKGKWRLVQEEKRASTYTFEKLSEKLANLKFVLHRHWIPLRSRAKFPKDFGHHFDIRFDTGLEFNLYKDPLKTEVEEEIKARRKMCKNIAPWMTIKKEHTYMKVGPLGTFVDPIDEGKAEIYELTPDFVSMKFFGKKLKGYWVYRRKPSGEQVLIKSRLPKPEEEKEEDLSNGDPRTGDFFKPFQVEKKKGWDYFWLHIYSSGGFTRCVADPKKYLPDLKIPPQVQEILVCLYRRPGTIHGARVGSIKVSDQWSPEQATKWVKSNKLHTWQGELIREKRKLSEDEKLDEAVKKVLDRIAKQAEGPSEEERKLNMELKKKKLELLEKWLEANKE